MKQKSILVIDDDPSVRTILNKTLSAEGFHIFLAPTGEEGLRLALTESIDLIILDLFLPGVDGFEVCRRLQEGPETAQIRVVIMSAIFVSEEDREEGLRCGAEDFLIKPEAILGKPLELDEIRTKVREILEGSYQKPLLPPPPRILVVDDDEGVQRILSMRLRNEGYQVDLAKDGVEGIRLFKENKPHLVLTDIRMPKASGLDMLRQIREVDHLVPVILMTAYGSEAVAVESLQRGATDYLIKPFESANVHHLIHQHIESAHWQRKRDRLFEQLKATSLALVGQVHTLREEKEKGESLTTQIQFDSRLMESVFRCCDKALTQNPVGVNLIQNYVLALAEPKAIDFIEGDNPLGEVLEWGKKNLDLTIENSFPQELKSHGQSWHAILTWWQSSHPDIPLVLSWREGIQFSTEPKSPWKEVIDRRLGRLGWIRQGKLCKLRDPKSPPPMT